MVQYIRELYVDEGYDEVITPQVFDPSLFRTSGHLGNYNENMFRLWTEDELEATDGASAASPQRGPHQTDAKQKATDVRKQMQDQSFGLKPMNCPSHCVIFGARKRSYRELPFRMADFGRLHRYERGGVVHGLARVRSFSQDDAHIFCAEEDVGTESAKFLKFFFGVYKAFGFEGIDVKLATRPEKRIGSDESWERAERALAVGLEQAGLKFDYSPGEGAFYGPKIEFHVKDALKRSWQLATLQYDPNLPERFDLTYIGKDGHEHRPVMLHRAILGSLERFFAVYLEHVGGNFPVWISPKQAIILTVSDKVDDYAWRVHKELTAKGLRVDIDASSDKLGAKIRNARLARYPYICVVGAKEAESESVGVRSREKGELGAIKVAEFAAKVVEEAKAPRW
jgi:threonyl-tRNA synthetase